MLPKDSIHGNGELLWAKNGIFDMGKFDPTLVACLVVLGVVVVTAFLSKLTGGLFNAGKHAGTETRGDRRSKPDEDSGHESEDEEREITLNDLMPKEKRIVYKIGSSEESPTIDQVIPDFSRGSEEHEWLHNLRKKEILSTVDGGRLRGSKQLRLKRRGREIFEKYRDHLAEYDT